MGSHYTAVPRDHCYSASAMPELALCQLQSCAMRVAWEPTGHGQSRGMQVPVPPWGWVGDSAGEGQERLGWLGVQKGKGR